MVSNYYKKNLQALRDRIIDNKLPLDCKILEPVVNICPAQAKAIFSRIWLILHAQ